MVENGGNVVPISLGVDKASDAYHQCQHEGIFNNVLSFFLPHGSHLFILALIFIHYSILIRSYLKTLCLKSHDAKEKTALKGGLFL